MSNIKNNWSDTVKTAVWKKGRINPDYSPKVLRWDRNGNLMMWSEYGQTHSKFGWKIDLINPALNEGEEDLNNLHPVNNSFKTE